MLDITDSDGNRRLVAKHAILTIQKLSDGRTKIVTLAGDFYSDRSVKEVHRAMFLYPSEMKIANDVAVK